jgi:hypothetical protein
MTDRPILFSGPMVCALLAGRKTQTRRLATSRPTGRFEIGDRLWVRESILHAPASHGFDLTHGMLGTVGYYADGDGEWRDRAKAGGAKSRPSIHMPRWAARLVLTVTDIRTQPLQDIGEDDARAEGVVMVAARNYRDGYAVLWNSLHTKAGERWDDNPDVIAVTFTVQRRNIDAPAGTEAA